MFGFDVVGIGSIIGSVLLVVVFLYLVLSKGELPDSDSDKKPAGRLSTK